MALGKLGEIYANARPRDAAERRLLTKLDCTLLPIVCLLYWSNYLNRTNYAFAYTSGMRQELNFQGNDFTSTNSVFSAIYCVAQIPHAFFVPRVPSRWYFSFMALCWGVCSVGLAFVTNVPQVYAIRALTAFVEASTFSGSHYLLGSWYRHAELGKRSALFACSAQLGSLFSGILQGAIYDSLNGNGGRSGWRWTFLVDGVIAIALALVAFWVLPSSPKQGANYLFSAEERELAINRLPRTEEVKILSKRAVRQILGGWPFWMFGVLFGVSTQLEAFGINGIFPQWLATTSVSVSKRSYYALPQTAFAIVTTVAGGFACDIFGKRWRINFVQGFGMILAAGVYLGYDSISNAGKYFALVFGGIGYMGQAANFTWANEAGRSDFERAATLFGMNLFSNAINAWWVLLLWPVTTAPKYTRGMISTIPIAIFTMAWASLMRWTELRSRHRTRAALEGARDDAEKRAAAGVIPEQDLDDPDKSLADPTPNERRSDDKF